MLALLLSVGLAIHSVERMIPVPQVAPGIKLGLANIVSLIGLFCLPYTRVLAMVILRSLIASLFGGGPTAFLFSAIGGVASATTMYLAIMHGYKALSLVSVSVIGALIHNLGQLAVASVVIGAPKLYVYLPVLMVSGGITGFVVGVISCAVLCRLVRIESLGPVFRVEVFQRFFGL